MSNQLTYQFSSSIDVLRELVAQGKQFPLPGHQGLELVIDQPRYQVHTPADARLASVVLLIHQTAGYPSILFIQRTDHINEDKHRGQIAFPGGKLENGETLKECAFREMEEEIGISLPYDHPTALLTPLYVGVSNFLIHPFVAFADKISNPIPNPEEVSAVIDSPLTDLHCRYSIRRKDITVRDMVLKNVPYYQVGGRTLWGATALIFSEFLQLINHHTSIPPNNSRL